MMLNDVPWPLVSVLIALVALWVAVKNYQRKGGLDIRGGYGVTSSVECRDSYVSSVMLENAKDRSVTIFEVYLQLGRSVYLSVIDFGSSPLVLKPFETFSKELGPIDLYQSNLSRYDLNEMLLDLNVRKRLVCSTSDGKYVVPSAIRMWAPSSFSNALTGVIQPLRSEYKGVVVGGNVDYIVEIVRGKGDPELVLLRSESYRVKVFNSFMLTPASLESRDALVEFINERRIEGEFAAAEFDVVDVKKWRTKRYAQYDCFSGEIRVLRDHSFWGYHVVGRWVAYQERRAERAYSTGFSSRVQQVKKD